MLPEFYLIIFLMVAMLIFVWFYSRRAQSRGGSRSGDKNQTGEQERS